MIVFAFVNQADPDVKRKLQSIERLEEKNVRELVTAVEKVYRKKETEEQKEERKIKKDSWRGIGETKSRRRL